jgi:hypothetical protein
MKQAIAHSRIAALIAELSIATGHAHFGELDERTIYARLVFPVAELHHGELTHCAKKGEVSLQ